MARYVHPDISEARENPTPGSEMTIVLILEEGTTSDVAELVRDSEASVREVFDTDMILVETPETNIDYLCKLPGVSSVSPDGDMEMLA